MFNWVYVFKVVHSTIIRIICSVFFISYNKYNCCVHYCQYLICSIFFNNINFCSVCDIIYPYLYEYFFIVYTSQCSILSFIVVTVLNILSVCKAKEEGCSMLVWSLPLSADNNMTDDKTGCTAAVNWIRY